MERCRVFGWIMMHDRVFSKMNLAKRGLGVDVNCPQCQNLQETSLHILRDCRSAKTWWNSTVPSHLQQSFFNGNYSDWVELNLSNGNLLWNGIRWDTVFLYACWWICKWRNNFIFNNIKPPLDSAMFLHQKIMEVWMYFRKKTTIR